MKGEFSVINSLVHSWPVLNYYYYYHYYNLQGFRRSDTGIAIPSTPASVPGIGESSNQCGWCRTKSNNFNIRLGCNRWKILIKSLNRGERTRSRAECCNFIAICNNSPHSRLERHQKTIISSDKTEHWLPSDSSNTITINRSQLWLSTAHYIPIYVGTFTK